MSSLLHHAPSRRRPRPPAFTSLLLNPSTPVSPHRQGILVLFAHHTGSTPQEAIHSARHRWPGWHPLASMSTAAAADSEEKRIELVVSSHDRRPSSLHSHHCDPDVTIAIRPRYQHPPLLLDVAKDARSLIWQYMDNRSAVQYLSTCKQLHALYHTFPLTERVSPSQFRSIPRIAALLDTAERPCEPIGCPRWLWMGCWLQWLCLACCVSIAFIIAAAATRSAFLLVYLSLSVGITVLVRLLWSCFPQRTHCCDEGRWLTKYWKPRLMPRIVRLAAWSEVRLVAYLQHVVQASIADSSDSLHRWRLPSTLRRLMLSVHVHGELQAGVLPPRLSLLQLINVTPTATLEPGLCPDALRTLVLFYESYQQAVGPPAASPFIQPIAAGVLPSQLQRLVITWPRSLADLALPPSLKWLDVRELSNLPIPPGCLPAGLQRLWLRSSCSFDPSNLRGALPSSLQLLQFDCPLSQPVTAELLSEVPQLDILDLGGCYSYPLHAGNLAPLTQLRVLRGGVRAGRQPFAPGELPLSLQELTVVAEAMEDVEELVPVAVRHAGLVVGFECVHSLPGAYSDEDLFNDMCLLDEQHTESE